jgi:hypothetical protein
LDGRNRWDALKSDFEGFNAAGKGFIVSYNHKVPMQFLGSSDAKNLLYE